MSALLVCNGVPDCDDGTDEFFCGCEYILTDWERGFTMTACIEQISYKVKAQYGTYVHHSKKKLC